MLTRAAAAETCVWGARGTAGSCFLLSRSLGGGGGEPEGAPCWRCLLMPALARLELCTLLFPAWLCPGRTHGVAEAGDSTWEAPALSLLLLSSHHADPIAHPAPPPPITHPAHPIAHPTHTTRGNLLPPCRCGGRGSGCEKVRTNAQCEDEQWANCRVGFKCTRESEWWWACK